MKILLHMKNDDQLGTCIAY